MKNSSQKFVLTSALLLASVASQATITLTSTSPNWFLTQFESSSPTLTGGGFFNPGTSSNVSTSAFARMWFATRIGGNPEYPVGTNGTDFTSGSGNTMSSFLALGTGNINNFTFTCKYTLIPASASQATVKMEWSLKDNRTNGSAVAVSVFPYADLSSQTAADVTNDTLAGSSVTLGSTTGLFKCSTPSNSSAPVIYYKSEGRTIDGFEGSDSSVSGTALVRSKMTNATADTLTNAIATGVGDVAACFRYDLNFGGTNPSVQSGTVYLGYNMIPASLVSVTGKVTLENWLGSPRPVTVEVRNVGSTTPLETYTVTPDGSGNYSFNTALQGNYDIALKSSNWLRKVASNVAIGASGGTAGTLSLINGDVIDDNTVDSSDYFALSDAYDTVLGDAAFNASADLNGDNLVDSSDYFILSDAYELSGQP